MAILFLALLYVAHKFEATDAQILVAVYSSFYIVFIICALALLFSSFSSPLLSNSIHVLSVHHLVASPKTCVDFATYESRAHEMACEWRSILGTELFRFKRDQFGGARRTASHRKE